MPVKVENEVPDNPFEWFDGILVINLDKDVDRWKSFVAESKKMGFYDRVVRIPGVYHEIGSYGCAMSHKKAVEYAKDMGWKNVLVLEDDVRFLYDRDKTHAVLKEATDNLPEDWGLLFLGINPRPGQVPIAPKTNPVSPKDLKWWGEFAFAVNASMYDFLIEAVPENVKDFTPMHRGDMVNMEIPYNRKSIVNPCLVSVHGFETQTGSGLQKKGEYKPTNGDANIIREYLRHGLIKDDLYETTTIIITAGLRDTAFKNLLKSINKYYPGIKIIAADDSIEGVSKPSRGVLQEFPDVEFWVTPYYQGVSAKRNFLVEQVKTPYLVLCEDDFLFTEGTDLRLFKDLFEKSGADILGGKLTGNKAAYYEYDLELLNKVLYYLPPGTSQEVTYLDIIVNFFIARKDAVARVKWDENLKTVEHTEFFYRAKYSGIVVASTPKVTIDHVRYAAGKEYRAIRGAACFKKMCESAMGTERTERGANVRRLSSSARKFSCGVYKQRGLSNLFEVTGVLNKHGKEYWVSNGTLLGMYREDDLIAHDSDLDVQIPVKELTLNLVRDILNKRFTFVHMFGTIEEGLELSFSKNGVKIDLFAVYPDPSGKGQIFSLWKSGRKVDYYYPEFKTVIKEWKGYKMRVPENIPELLELEYGPGWTKSDSGIKWDYAWSRFNIIVPEKYGGSVEDYKQAFNTLPLHKSKRVTDKNTIMRYLEGVLPNE